MMFAQMAPATETALREWLQNRAVLLRSESEAAAIDVALGFMQLAFERKIWVVPGMVEGLILMLEHGSLAAQSAAAWALAWINNESLRSKAWRPSKYEIERVISVVNRQVSEARAVQFLSWILGRYGERDARAVEPLIQWIGHENDKLRISVVEALGNIRDVRAVLPLCERLEDADWRVRKSAAAALGKIGSAEAIGALSACLQRDSNCFVREAAALALGTVGPMEVVEVLESGLASPVGIVRRATLEALSNIGFDPEATSTCNLAAELVLRGLNDGDTDVRREAVRALGNLGPVIKDTLIRDRIANHLIDRLTDEAASVRLEATRVLGLIKNQNALEPLMGLSDHGSILEQYLATFALGQLGDSRVLEVLTKQLNSAEAAIAVMAAEQLGTLADSRATDSLLARVGDPDSDMRRASVASLGKIGDTRALDVLTGLLNDPVGAVRKSAVGACALLLSGIDNIDRKLLARDFDADEPFIDPWVEIGEIRMQEAAACLKLPYADVRCRYEALAGRLLLRLPNVGTPPKA